MRKLPAGIAVFAALLLAAGCSSGGQQDVFIIDSGFTSTIPTQTREINDIGLSQAWLHNKSSHSVRITSIRFVNPPRALRLLNVYAYSYRETFGFGLISGAGALPRECPTEFKPHALDSVTFPPRADPPWLVVLAFTLNKPGKYRLNQVRIDYVTNGHNGWQYQNTNATITVKNPPRPGPRPLPPSAVCDKKS